MHRRYLTTLAMLTLGVACAEPATSELSQAAVPIYCEDFLCGNPGNSPEIDNLGLHELNLAYPNYLEEPRNRFKIKGFYKDGVQYIPLVEGAKLTGRHIPTGQFAFGGSDLEHAELRVVNPTGTEYALKIRAQGWTNYFGKPPGKNQQMSPWYEIEWVVVKNGQVGRDWKNICSGPWPEEGPDTLDLPKAAVVLFEGDRVNALRKVVTHDDSRWINIGCAGHALSKLHLAGLSRAAHNQPQSTFLFTPVAVRTAFLRTMSADYCGNGSAWTIAGQELGWVDHRNWMASSTPDYKIEARFTELGASCLSTPRLIANPSKEGDDAFPGLTKDLIEETCGRTFDPCLGSVTDAQKDFFVSGNPP